MKVKSELADEIKNYKHKKWAIESQSQESVAQTARNLSVVAYQFGLKVPELLTDPAQKNDGEDYLDGVIALGKAETHLDVFMRPWRFRALREDTPPETDAIREISHYLDMAKAITQSARGVIFDVLSRRPVNTAKNKDMVAFTTTVLFGSAITDPHLFPVLSVQPYRIVGGCFWSGVFGWFGSRYIKGERKAHLRVHPRIPPKPSDYFGQLKAYLSIIHDTGELPKPPDCLILSPRRMRRLPAIAK